MKGHNSQGRLLSVFPMYTHVKDSLDKEIRKLHSFLMVDMNFLSDFLFFFFMKTIP